MSKRDRGTAWIVGVRLALLAMIMNAAAFLLPEHQTRFAAASDGVSSVQDGQSTGIPLEALRRADLSPEQASGVVIPCHGFDGLGGPQTDLVETAGLSSDDESPLPPSKASPGHACDICLTLTTKALASPSAAMVMPLDFVAFVHRLSTLQAPPAFAGHAPASRDPPKGLA